MVHCYMKTFKIEIEKPYFSHLAIENVYLGYT